MRPSPQFDVQDTISTFPRMMPFLLIEKNALYVLDSAEGLDMRLFRALACEKVGCGFGEDKADGEVEMV